MASIVDNRQLLHDEKLRYVPRGVATTNSLFVSKAEGSVVWDERGKEYLDFAGGIGTLNVGHRHPLVVEAIEKQLERFTHMCFQVAGYDSYVEVAKRLTAVTPGSFPKKAFLATTGAEAVENAIKIARAYTGKAAVIAFTGAFHGRTLLGMTLTGKVRPYKASFGPFAPEVYHAPYPYEYRGWTAERSLQAFREVLHNQVDANHVAAVLLEPVLGEGGFVPAPAEFVEGLYELTREHGMVFIADEIQTGFGRTGDWFAVTHSGVVPDLITVAKSLAGGLPLSGVVGRADVMDAVEPGGLGGTYGGNPMACAAALGVFEAFERDGLLERGRRLGDVMRRGFESLADEFEAVGDVRGLGAMQAMELVKDRVTKEPDASLADFMLKHAEAHGLVMVKAGIYGNVLRFLPPLNTTEEQVQRALQILKDGFRAARG